MPLARLGEGREEKKLPPTRGRPAEPDRPTSRKQRISFGCFTLCLLAGNHGVAEGPRRELLAYNCFACGKPIRLPWPSRTAAGARSYKEKRAGRTLAAGPKRCNNGGGAMKNIIQKQRLVRPSRRNLAKPRHTPTIFAQVGMWINPKRSRMAEKKWRKASESGSAPSLSQGLNKSTLRTLQRTVAAHASGSPDSLQETSAACREATNDVIPGSKSSRALAPRGHRLWPRLPLRGGREFPSFAGGIGCPKTIPKAEQFNVRPGKTKFARGCYPIGAPPFVGCAREKMIDVVIGKEESIGLEIQQGRVVIQILDDKSRSPTEKSSTCSRNPNAARGGLPAAALRLPQEG